MIFVDTNYFVRFLINDNNEQFIDVKALFVAGANREQELFSSTIVFFEIYWLFKSFYRKTDSEIYKILSKILSLEFIYFEERDVLKKTLEIFKKDNLGLEDSYNIIYSKTHGASGFKTFDKDLLKKLFKK